MNLLADLGSGHLYLAKAPRYEFTTHVEHRLAMSSHLHHGRHQIFHLVAVEGTKFFGDSYEFVPGKDETIFEGKAAYAVSFGEMLYRSWDAVLRFRQEGLAVGLINKSTLNLVDEQTLRKSEQVLLCWLLSQLKAGEEKYKRQRLGAKERVLELENQL